MRSSVAGRCDFTERKKSWTGQIVNCQFVTLARQKSWSSSFDFFYLKLTTSLIQKICANIIKFKSFLKILY